MSQRASLHQVVKLCDKFSPEEWDKAAEYAVSDHTEAVCVAMARLRRHRIVEAVPARIPNPPIAGHELLNEGHTHIAHWSETRPESLWSPPKTIGGCACGAQPEDLATISINGMKRWHREHKAAIREGKIDGAS